MDEGDDGLEVARDEVARQLGQLTEHHRQNISKLRGNEKTRVDIVIKVSQQHNQVEKSAMKPSQYYYMYNTEVLCNDH